MGRMSEFYRKEIAEHKKEIASLENKLALHEEGESLISIGTYIYDLDAHKYAVVTGLENGCIDFGAAYLDGSYSRGYNFTVRNWKIASEEGLKKYRSENLNSQKQ